jgi:hypothetical protein
VIENLVDAFNKKILHSTGSTLEIQKKYYSTLLKTYLLSGEFSFYGGASLLFFNDEQVVINKYQEIKDLALVDNIHGHNWDQEEKSIKEKYLNCINYKNLEGEKLCLIGTQWSNSNMFHLLIDTIGKISILRKFFDLSEITILIPNGSENFRKIIQTFDLKYIVYDSDTIYKGNFLVPSMPSHFGGASYDVYQTLQFLSKNINLSAYQDYKYVYISRKKAKKRSMVNEDELIQYLQKTAHFKEVYLEDLTFADEIAIFKCAEFVVAPHGAGLVWSIFQNKGKLLEIFSPYYVNICFRNFPRGSNVEYISFYSDEEKKFNYYHPELANDDYSLDIEKFGVFFKKIFSN